MLAGQLAPSGGQLLGGCFGGCSVRPVRDHVQTKFASRHSESLLGIKARLLVNPTNELIYALSLRVRGQDRELARESPEI